MSPTTSSRLAVARERFRWTTNRYHRAIEAGIFTEYDKAELLFGELVTKSAISKRHADCVTRIGSAYTRRYGGAYLCSIQNPITVPPYSEPEPDFKIVNRETYRLRSHHPEPPDILLIIEVADSTLDTDRIDKAKLYAMAGLPEYWIVNLKQDVLELHTEPDAANGVYNAIRRYAADATFESPFCGSVAVADLLPEAPAA